MSATILNPAITQQISRTVVNPNLLRGLPLPFQNFGRSPSQAMGYQNPYQETMPNNYRQQQQTATDLQLQQSRNIINRLNQEIRSSIIQSDISQQEITQQQISEQQIVDQHNDLYNKTMRDIDPEHVDEFPAKSKLDKQLEQKQKQLQQNQQEESKGDNRVDKQVRDERAKLKQEIDQLQKQKQQISKSKPVEQSQPPVQEQPQNELQKIEQKLNNVRDLLKQTTDKKEKRDLVRQEQALAKQYYQTRGMADMSSIPKPSAEQLQELKEQVIKIKQDDENQLNKPYKPFIPDKKPNNDPDPNPNNSDSDQQQKPINIDENMAYQRIQQIINDGNKKPEQKAKEIQEHINTIQDGDYFIINNYYTKEDRINNLSDVKNDIHGHVDADAILTSLIE